MTQNLFIENSYKSIQIRFLCLRCGYSDFRIALEKLSIDIVKPSHFTYQVSSLRTIEFLYEREKNVHYIFCLKLLTNLITNKAYISRNIGT